MSRMLAGVGRCDSTPPVGVPPTAATCSTVRPAACAISDRARPGYRNDLPTDAERPRGGYEIDISPFRPGADRRVAAAAGRVLEGLA